MQLFCINLFFSNNRTSKSFVKKKAALTLLRLFRKHPDVIPVTDWADRIISLMDEYDLVSVWFYIVDSIGFLTSLFRVLHLVSPRWFWLYPKVSL